MKATTAIVTLFYAQGNEGRAAARIYDWTRSGYTKIFL